MVIATILSVHCFACAALQCKPDQCRMLPSVRHTTRGGYRMFHGLHGSALTLPLVPVSHEPCTLGLVSTSPLSLAHRPFPHPVSHGSDPVGPGRGGMSSLHCFVLMRVCLTATHCTKGCQVVGSNPGSCQVNVGERVRRWASQLVPHSPGRLGFEQPKRWLPAAMACTLRYRCVLRIFPRGCDPYLVLLVAPWQTGPPLQPRPLVPVGFESPTLWPLRLRCHRRASSLGGTLLQLNCTRP